MTGKEHKPDASTRHGADEARLAHVRHDLRTPVNAIIGYSEMMLEDTEEHEDLSAILQEINLLGRQLLEGINEQLGASAESIDWPALAVRVQRGLEPLCRQVLECCATLLGKPEPKIHALIPDVQRLLTAANRFVELLHSSFDLEKIERAPAAAAPARANPEPSATRAAREEPTPIADEENWENRNGHVLVVDDNQFNRDILARGLHRQNHYFALAANGRQALDMLASKAFDLVLLDIMMPEMDGFETLARIKADPSICHVPVIMISALDQIDSVVRCIQMGAEDYLPKPFDPVLLRARVGACLEKKRLRDQELDYLRNVAAVTAAAAGVEAGSFDPDSIAEVAERGDPLGQLARVFQSMAREVRAREQRLQMQVRKLSVEIDEARKAKQVAEITETDYFQELQQKAQCLRRRARGERAD